MAENHNFPSRELAYYIWDNEKVKPKFDIRKIQAGGLRYYFTHNNRWGARFYMSVTSFIKSCMPTSEHLVNWKVERGAEQAKFEADMAAHYGTFMHDCLLELIVSKKVKMSKFSEDADRYIAKNYLSQSIKSEWMRKLESDIIAWIQWSQDVSFVPLVIEYPIIGNHHFMLGGRIDLIGQITEIKREKGYWGETYKTDCKGGEAGDPKETYKVTENKYIVMVDLKSGRKGFYESHQLQLVCYQHMWNLHFGDVLKVEKIYNWRPKDWRSPEGSKYEFKDQTDTPYKSVYKSYYQIVKKLGKLKVTRAFKTIMYKSVDITVDVDTQYKVHSAVQKLKHESKKKTQAEKVERRKSKRK